jgi:hypothetical protein
VDVLIGLVAANEAVPFTGRWEITDLGVHPLRLDRKRRLIVFTPGMKLLLFGRLINSDQKKRFFFKGDGPAVSPCQLSLL